MPESQSPSAVVVQANQGDVYLAYALGLLSGGPAGCLIAPKAIKAFGGKYGPWIFVGCFAGPILWIIQVFLLVTVMGAVLGTGAGVVETFSSIGKFGGSSDIEQLKQDNERTKALLEWANQCIANEEMCK